MEKLRDLLTSFASSRDGEENKQQLVVELRVKVERMKQVGENTLLGLVVYL